ncbi:hypothetical protein BY996DRAFT_6411073 [Phakopsora pachyrhizi]|nr:hypothetical protein BY996DRAFT_6411073 [Phakopsora pachyrhizi]
MFGPTSTANNQSPMARSGLSEGPLSNIGTPTTYGKQRNGSRMADEYMIKDALKAQAEFKKKKKSNVIAGVEAFGSLWIKFTEPIYGLSCLRICIENLKKLHPEKGKRTLKKLNPDKNSDQQQQQQQQEMSIQTYRDKICSKLAIAGGLLDLFRMLGIEEGLKGEIGAEEEEEKATPVLSHMRGPPLGYKLCLQITSIGSRGRYWKNISTYND